MSYDRRELILSQVFTTLGTVTPADTDPSLPPVTTLTVIRNRGELPEDKRPAIILLDGVEEAIVANVQRTGRRGISPNQVRLRFQLFVLLVPRTPRNLGVGQELNAYRGKIVHALDNDEELLRLMGENGEFIYHGGNTDLLSGQAMQGQFKLDFSIVYPFNPSDL